MWSGIAHKHPWEPRRGYHDWWLQRHHQLLQYTNDHQKQIHAVFIGASIVQYYQTEDKELWDRYYAVKGAANYGIKGDSTSKVLWRIQNHELDGLRPKVVVVSCGPGYNSLDRKPSPSGPDVLEGLKEIIRQLRAKFTAAKVIIIGHTPYTNPSINEKSKQINVEMKKKADDKNVFFIDLTPYLTDSSGHQIPELFLSDHLHLSLEGYRLCSADVHPWEPQPGSGGWLQRHQQLSQYTHDHQKQIHAIFIGASITDYYQSDGRDLWNSYYVPKGAANYGIGGDSTSNVLWRIQNKELDGLNPKVVVVSCGPGYNTMNRNPSPSGPDVLRGLEEIVKELRAKFPAAKVIIIGHTPYIIQSISERSKQINVELKKTADNKNVFFIDLTPNLTDSSGHQKPELFKGDHLHLTLAGIELCSADVHPWEPQPGSGRWLQRHQQLSQYTRDHQKQIHGFFIGASGVARFETDGRQLWDSYYEPKGVANYGIGGDTTSNVLWRIQNQELDGLTPKVIVMSSGPGFNTMHHNESVSASDVLRGQQEIVSELRAKFAAAKHIIIGHTPYTNPSISERSKQINVEMKKLADNNTVFFIDLTPNLTDSSGHQIPELFNGDHLHLSLDGSLITSTVVTFLGIELCSADVQPWEPSPTGWTQRHKDLVKYTHDHQKQIHGFFIGASIVDNYQTDGKELWDSYYAAKGVANYGLGGDSTSNVLWRIQNKEVDGLTPKVIVITSGPGFNSMNRNPSPSAPDVLRGQQEIVSELRAKFTAAKMLIIGHTPYTNPSISEKSKQINVELKKLADNNTVFFIDLTPNLTDSSGHQIPELFKSDHLHLTLEGYSTYDDKIAKSN
ncbi:unnamed protein product [Medioppia subpectinata]|uniref:SGNH hydrolase-type esterase domain-containing protein n=1 Tax=Medioppia subpectinata TaxID=1979941 RepID=A0A7R9KMR5_9ACAR|nr:unnamed protein product [Medioppia subpectinata]CAG2105419.1 unnamed protein product [Medioppia subpectinata]